MSLVILAAVSVNGQIMKGFEKYLYNYCTVESLPQQAREGIMIALSSLGPEKYISEISSVESALCLEEKDYKKFLKKARKVIKKEHIPLISSSDMGEEMRMEIYAKEGEIILFYINEEAPTITIIK
ncbi:MAG: hypothetical protein K2K82_09085 [Muribaculaceae bacterium]|nr:hypothetical protein [Muribaculaceae bacterium]